MNEFETLREAVDNSQPPQEVLDEMAPLVSSIKVGDDATAPRPVEQDVDWWDYTKQSADAYWIDPSELLRDDFETQIGYDGTAQGNVEMIPQTFSQEQIEDVMSAESPEERDYLIDEFGQHNELMSELSAGGIPGVGVQLAAAMFDPTALGAILLTEGMAAPWIMAAKTTRMATIASRMAKSGLVAAGTEAGLSGLRMATDVNYDEEDAMLDVALATTFGTALGWMARPVKDSVAARTADKIEGVAGHADDSLSAAKVKPEDGVAFQDVRVDSLASITKHGNDEASKIGKEMLEDAIDPTHRTAALQAMMDREHYTTQFNKVAYDSMREWQKGQGFGTVRRILNPIEEVRKQEEFAKLVFRQLEIGDVDDTNVKAVADMLSKQRDEIAKASSASGMPGFSELDEMNKITHQWNFTKLAQIDDDEAISLIWDSLKAGARKYGRITDDMDVDEVAAHEAYLKAMAVGFTRRAKSVTLGDEFDFDNILLGNVDAAQFLKETLTEADLKRLNVKALMKEAEINGTLKPDRIGNIPLDEQIDLAIKAILRKSLKTKSNKKNAPNTIDRGKQRMDLDLSVTNGDLQMIDLFENNAFKLHHRYVREMTGWRALADNVKSRSIKGPQDWKKFLGDVKGKEVERLAKTGSKQKVEKTYTKLEDKLEKARKEIFGENIYDEGDNNFYRGLAIARRYNFTTSMGQAAISAFSEMGRVFAEGGLRNTLRNVPELKNILKASFKAGKGKTLAAEVNSFGASFGDEYLMTALAGFDGDSLVDVGTFTRMDKADLVSQKAQRVMAQASLLMPVDRVMRQAGFAIQHTAIYRHFKYGEKLNFDLKTLGLEPDDIKELKAAVIAHTKEGKLGGVEKVGIEHWEPSIRHKYLQGMTRSNARQVQKMIAGQDVTWMHHPLARVFMQFRTFVANSYTKHFLADTHTILKGGNSRSTALVSIGMSGMLAALGYKTRVEINALGREDSDEFREKMLSDSNFYRNAFTYMPFMGSGSTAWDMSVGSLKPDWAISPYRSSGLQSTGLLSNPTADKFDRTKALFRDALNDDEYERYGSTMPRRYGFLIPFSNTIPGAVALNLTDKSLRE